MRRITKEEEETSAIITGIVFNEPFYAIPAPPPWAAADPCWSCWKAAKYWGEQLIHCGSDTDQHRARAQDELCVEIRRHFFSADRAYANCMDRVYGLGRTDHSTKPSAK